MHPQVTAALSRANPGSPKPNDIAQFNAEKLLYYIEDINLEGNVGFKPTLAGSLFISWKVAEWEFRMECAKNGYIIYIFSKSEYEKACGCMLCDEFIPQFEKYLLML